MAVKTEVLEVMVVLLRVWAQTRVTPEEKAPSTQLDPVAGNSCVAISSSEVRSCYRQFLALSEQHTIIIAFDWLCVTSC